MSSAFDRNVSVSQPYYCKDENGDLDYDHPMYTWMAIRSRGPNTLNDTYLCGTTTIENPIFPNPLCAYSYAPCTNIFLQQIPGVLSEIVEAANQPEEWHIINSQANNAYTQQFNYSTDNDTAPGLNHPILVASSAGLNPSLLKTIGVQNVSGKTLLVEVELNATVANDTNTGQLESMTYYFAFGTSFDVQPLQPIVGSNPLKIGIFDSTGEIPQQAEEAITIKAYVSLQNNQECFPIWRPYNPVTPGENSLYWRSINFSARVLGCEGTMGSLQTKNIAGPGT